MAKIDGEKIKSDEVVEKFRIALAEFGLKQIDEAYQGRVKNPEMLFKSLVEVYQAIK